MKFTKKYGLDIKREMWGFTVTTAKLWDGNRAHVYYITKKIEKIINIYFRNKGTPYIRLMRYVASIRG